MSFPAELITDKVCELFEKLLVDAKWARHYNNRMFVNCREQRSLHALLFDEIKLC